MHTKQEIMQKKLDLYDKFFDEMLKINEEEANLLHNSMLESQIKQQSIEENFIYLDEMRDLTDLNIKEQKIINEQNNFYNYEKLKTKLEKFQDAYSIVKYMTYIPKWIPFT